MDARQMDAEQILKWFGLNQGDATKAEIVKVWRKIPDSDGIDHTRDFLRIGCERK